MNKEPAILSILEWWYYYSSSIIKVLEGIVILITFGLVKISWVARYESYRNEHILKIKLKDVATWIYNNPNFIASLEDKDK